MIFQISISRFHNRILISGPFEHFWFLVLAQFHVRGDACAPKIKSAQMGLKLKSYYETLLCWFEKSYHSFITHFFLFDTKGKSLMRIDPLSNVLPRVYCFFLKMPPTRSVEIGRTGSRSRIFRSFLSDPLNSLQKGSYDKRREVAPVYWQIPQKVNLRRRTPSSTKYISPIYGKNTIILRYKNNWLDHL